MNRPQCVQALYMHSCTHTFIINLIEEQFNHVMNTPIINSPSEALIDDLCSVALTLVSPV